MNRASIPRDVWTQREEAALKELVERRARIMAERRKPLDAIATHIEADTVRGDSIVDSLIKHADALREALRPFDSGVRTQREDRP